MSERPLDLRAKNLGVDLDIGMHVTFGALKPQHQPYKDLVQHLLVMVQNMVLVLVNMRTKRKPSPAKSCKPAQTVPPGLGETWRASRVPAYSRITKAHHSTNNEAQRKHTTHTHNKLDQKGHCNNQKRISTQWQNGTANSSKQHQNPIMFLRTLRFKGRARCVLCEQTLATSLLLYVCLFS